MNKQQIIELVNSTTTPQIKAGETHRFNNIWLVVTDGRIFCRQYSFSKKSWYTAFLEDANGYIKCGDIEIQIKGIIPSDIIEMGQKINEAYIEKYDKRLNHYPDIAHKMTGDKFMEKTMELVPVLTN